MSAATLNQRFSNTPSFRHLIKQKQTQQAYSAIDDRLEDIEFTLSNDFTFDNVEKHTAQDHRKHPILYHKKIKGKDRYWLVNPFNETATDLDENSILNKYVLRPEQFNQFRHKNKLVALTTDAPKCERAAFFVQFAAVQTGLQMIPANLAWVNILAGLASATASSLAYYAASHKAFKRTYGRDPSEQETAALRQEALQTFAKMVVTTLSWQLLPVALSMAYHAVLPMLLALPQAQAAFTGLIFGAALLMGITGATRLYFAERKAINPPTASAYVREFIKHFCAGLLMGAASLLPGVAAFPDSVSTAVKPVIDATSYWGGVALSSILVGLLGAVSRARIEPPQHDERLTSDTAFEAPTAQSNIEFDRLLKGRFWEKGKRKQKKTQCLPFHSTMPTHDNRK